MNKPLKPTVHARKEIIRKIIQNEWPPGTKLPAERKLSGALGVTRATLREVLKLIEKEGWITIQHGKASTVKDFWKEGGLGILTGLNENKDLFPYSLIKELLIVRSDILPICAKTAFEQNSHKFKLFTEFKIPHKDSTPEEFTVFDWKIQKQIIQISQNRVYRLIYNEFQPVFFFLGKEYFKIEYARISSIKYYEQLMKDIKADLNPENTIKKAMQESIAVWNKIQQ